MRLDFGDCGVANEALAQVGYNVRGAQLDGGELKGSIQINQIDSMLAMRVHASHRLLFIGEPVPGTVPFAFCDSAYFHGDTSEGADICGYQKGLKDTHCHWEGDMNVWVVSPDLVEATMHECGAMNALERFHGTNFTTLCPATTAFMRQQFERSLSGAVKSEAQILSMMVTLLEGGTEPEPWEQELKNVPMLRQFVQLAHDTAEEEPLTLPEVAKMMHIGKSTLSAACTETYGLSVMALMRQVRLEQCRMALLKPERGVTVETVMRKYRFNNRARFAATYRDAFGELPSAALQRGFGQLRIAGI